MKNQTKTSKAQRSILEILERAKGKHLRAEEIWQSLRSQGRDVHLSTVYRSLQALTTSGLVKRNYLQENHAHYELAGTPGIHLVCSQCGQVQEIGTVRDDSILDAVEKQLKDKFTVVDWQMQLTGRCAKCLEKVRNGAIHGR
jgi:Fur family ferric uptake transcriptional regulator